MLRIISTIDDGKDQVQANTGQSLGHKVIRSIDTRQIVFKDHARFLNLCESFRTATAVTAAMTGTVDQIRRRHDVERASLFRR